MTSLWAIPMTRTRLAPGTSKVFEWAWIGECPSGVTDWRPIVTLRGVYAGSSGVTFRVAATQDHDGVGFYIADGTLTTPSVTSIVAAGAGHESLELDTSGMNISAGEFLVVLASAGDWVVDGVEVIPTSGVPAALPGPLSTRPVLVSDVAPALATADVSETVPFSATAGVAGCLAQWWESTNGGAWAPAGDLVVLGGAAESLSHDVTATATPGDTIDVKLSVTDGARVVESSARRLTVASTASLTTPTDLVVAAEFTTSVTIQWADPTGTGDPLDAPYDVPPDYIDVRHRVAGTDEWTTIDEAVEDGAETYGVNGLAGGTTYDIQVRGQWGTGEDAGHGQWTASVSATTDGASVSAPSFASPPSLAASSTPVTPGETLTITPSSSVDDGGGTVTSEYAIHELGDAGNVFLARGSATSWTVTEAAVGVELVAREWATNAHSTVSEVSTETFTIAADVDASWAPISPSSATSPTNDSVTISGSVTDGAGWAISFMRDIDGAGEQVHSTASSPQSDAATPYSVSPTTPTGSTVEYWWRAELDGTVVDSDVCTVTVGEPVPPAGFVSTSPTAAQLEEEDQLLVAYSTENAEGWTFAWGWSTSEDVADWTQTGAMTVPNDAWSVNATDDVPASTAGSTLWNYGRLTKTGEDTIWSDPCVVQVGGGAAAGTPDMAEVLTDEVTTNSTTHTYDLSTLTISADDYLLAAVYVGHSTVSTPSGWSQLGGSDLFGSGGNLNLRLFGKVADGSETSMLFTTTSSVKSSARIHRLTDVSTTQAPGVSVSSTVFGLSPDPASASASWGAGDNLAIAGYVAGNTGATLTGSAGYSDAGATDAANGGTVGSGWQSFSGATVDPSAFTISDGTEGENYATFSVLFAPTSVEGGGSPPPAAGAPTIPTFSADVTVTSGQNLATITASEAAGTHFFVESGAIIDNVRAKTGNHYRLAAGGVWDGSGKGYAFRPETTSSDDVVIEGDPNGPRAVLANYGNSTSRQDYGVIMGSTNDPLAGQYNYNDVDGWYVAHLELDGNASNGIKLGSNWTVYDCRVVNHSVTGINGDRFVGGLVYGCELEDNAFNPATGAYSNGANIKVAWVNANEGRTSIMALSRTKAEFRIAECTLSGARIGIWFDLDCQSTLVENCTLTDHVATSIFHEGSNGGEVRYCTVNNSDGYGPAFGSNFKNAALCAGESTNIWFHHNTLNGCDYALMNRMSNRSSDWYNSNNGSYVNYAWPSGPRYWIKTTSAIPAEGVTANMWTGANRYEDNVLVGCNRVVINEGDNSGGMTTQGSTPVGTITFARNDYGGSPSIQFYDRSNTAVSLTAWRAGSSARSSDGI